MIVLVSFFHFLLYKIFFQQPPILQFESVRTLNKDHDPMGIEMLSDVLTGNGGKKRLIASSVGACVGIICEVLAEKILRHRCFNGEVAVLSPIVYFYRNQRRSAVHGADADVVLHIGVGHLVSVQNVVVAVGLVYLDRAVEGRVYHGAAESFLAFDI